MIDEFTNRQGMHLTVIAILDDPVHKPVWLNLAPLVFTTKVTKLRSLVSGLQLLGGEQETVITGAAQQKEQETVDLEVMAHELGAALGMWFVDLGRGAEAAEVDLPVSTWEYLRGTSLLNKAQLVLNRMNGALAEALVPGVPLLADYGISATEATALGKEVSAYALVVAAPQGAIAERKSLTAVLRPRFKEVSDHLVSMDKLVLRFRGTPEGKAFANAWHASRVVRDLGHAKKKVVPPTPPVPPTP